MTEPDFDAGVEFPDDTGNIFLMRRKYGQIWLYHRHNNGPWKETREATDDDVKRWLERAANSKGAVAA